MYNYKIKTKTDCENAHVYVVSFLQNDGVR